MVPSVTYPGHQIDAEGLHPVVEKAQAIMEAPQPKNVWELKLYLGLLTYYSKFLPSMSTVLAPLYQLLRLRARWHWGKKEHESFLASKELLIPSYLLIHFNPDLPLLLA